VHAETYLRQLAETELRHAAGAPRFPGPGARLRIAADAFSAAGVLPAEVADDIVTGFEDAAIVRGTLKERGPRSTGPQAGWGTSPASADRAQAVGDVTVAPVGATFSVPTKAVHGRIYILSLFAMADRALVMIVADAKVRSAVDPLPVTHTWMRALGEFGSWRAAFDDLGREYRLGGSAGGSRGSDVTLLRYTGTVAIEPAPPADASWLELRGDRHSVRISLCGRPCPEVTTISLDVGPAEAHLRRRAESLLMDDAPDQFEAAEIFAEIVPAFDAVGVLPASSPAAAAFSALCAYIRRPGDAAFAQLPERWASVLAASPPAAPKAARGEITGAAHMPLTLAEPDGGTVAFGGLINDEGQTTLFGLAFRAPERDPQKEDPPSWWLRDDTGQWHVVSADGWTTPEPIMRFEGDVIPPLKRSVTSVDVFAAGRSAEYRATVRLTWWCDE
jgi:hypothetical protein